MRKLISVLIAAILVVPLLGQTFDYRTVGTNTTTILNIRPYVGTPPGSEPAVSSPGWGKIYMNSATGLFRISQNGGPWFDLFRSTGTPVTSFNARTGDITPAQSDYDPFFLTVAEGDARYAQLAATGVDSFNGRVGAVVPVQGDYDAFFTTTAEAIAAAPVQSVAGRTGAVTLAVADVSGAAPLASPALTGNPTAPTALTNDNDTSLATTAFVQAAIAGGSIAGVSSFNSRTGAVLPLQADYDTFFLTTAEGNALYAPIGAAVTSFNGRSGAVVPQQADYDAFFTTPAEVSALANVTSVFGRTGAVTALQADYDSFFMTSAETAATYAPLASPALTGNPTAPTAAANDSDTSVATTAFVQQEIADISTGVVSFNARTGAVVPAQADYDSFFMTQAESDARYALAGSFVESFNGRTGVVTPQQADYDAFFVTPSELGADYVTTNTVQTITAAKTIQTASSAQPLGLFRETGTANSLVFATGSRTAGVNTVNSSIDIEGDAVFRETTFLTPATSDNDTSGATTAFVRNAISTYASASIGDTDLDWSGRHRWALPRKRFDDLVTILGTTPKVEIGAASYHDLGGDPYAMNAMTENVSLALPRPSYPAGHITLAGGVMSGSSTMFTKFLQVGDQLTILNGVAVIDITSITNDTTAGYTLVSGSVQGLDSPGVQFGDWKLADVESTRPKAFVGWPSAICFNCTNAQANSRYVTSWHNDSGTVLFYVDRDEGWLGGTGSGLATTFPMSGASEWVMGYDSNTDSVLLSVNESEPSAVATLASIAGSVGSRGIYATDQGGNAAPVQQYNAGTTTVEGWSLTTTASASGNSLAFQSPAERSRRTITVQADGAGTNVSVVGMPTASHVLQGTAGTALRDDSGAYQRIATLATSGQFAGWVNIAGPPLKVAWKPSVRFVFKTGATIANSRLSACIGDTDLGSATPVATTWKAAGAIADTAVSTFWRVCAPTGGATSNCTTTSVSYAANTRYEVNIDWINATTWRVTINDVAYQLDHSVAATTDFYLYNRVYTTENVAKEILPSYYVLNFE